MTAKTTRNILWHSYSSTPWSFIIFENSHSGRRCIFETFRRPQWGSKTSGRDLGYRKHESHWEIILYRILGFICQEEPQLCYRLPEHFHETVSSNWCHMFIGHSISWFDMYPTYLGGEGGSSLRFWICISLPEAYKPPKNSLRVWM